MMHVPFNDLKKQNLSENLDLLDLIREKITESDFIGGNSIQEFEKNFSEVMQASYCASCANGTDALEIAFTCLNLRPGDEVIVPAQTWISTAEAVSTLGAVPVFCDTQNNVNQLMNYEMIQDLITPKTVGIVPVHLYGRTADLRQIKKIAQLHNLWVVEDCAQAHLAIFDNNYVGTTTSFGTFSFYPGKNLGALGDAGAIICSNQNLLTHFKMYASHGGLKKGEHKIEGRNSRLDAIQASVLNAKIPFLEVWTKARKEIASQYSISLEGIGDLELPTKLMEFEDHVFHLYVVATNYRDELFEYLKNAGISCGIHYRKCLPELECYRDRNSQHIVNARVYESKIISLPIFPEMTDGQVQYVTAKIKEFFDGIKTNS